MATQAAKPDYAMQASGPDQNGSSNARPKVPLHPKNPERICWGCTKYCPVNDLACGNGTIRTQHPSELFGDDWMDWSLDSHD